MNTKAFKLDKFSWSIIILTIAFILYIVVYMHSKNAPLLFPDPSQEISLEESKKIICDIDSVICNVSSFFIINYKVYDYHWILRLYPHIYAATFSVNNFHEIRLSPSNFNDVSALTMSLYHELRHVYQSDSSLYEEGGDPVAKCLDHNKVKQSTKEFSVKLDQWFQAHPGYSPVKPASYYANSFGNQLKDC